MRIEVALHLGCCSLGLLLLLLHQGTAAHIPDPPQVNCEWSRWSEWSACDPCTKNRRRSRSVEVFGQFEGLSCQGSIGEREFCEATTKCEEPPPAACDDTEFTCESGACVKLRLSCNGDYDCEDGSDEDCDALRKPCGAQVLQNNEQGRTAGYGINILGSDPRMNPFNNDFFNGRCERVRKPGGQQYDRLPWNVGVLNYETRVEETVSREIYEDSHTLLREILTEITSKIDVGLSFKFSASERPMSNSSLSIGAKVGADFEKKTMIKQVTEYTNTKNKSFMRVKGKIQLNTYRLRSSQLKVADDSLEHIRSLPLQYEKGIYFAFLEDYGTHYTKNGKAGGEYELVYVLNQDAITQKNLTEKKIQDCVKIGVSGDVGVSGVGGSGHFNKDDCNTVTNKDTAGVAGKAVVDKVMTSVRGGSLEAAVGMKTKLDKEGVMDLATFQAWARSVADFPALLSSEPEPIYDLVPVEMPSAKIRVANIKRAIADYVAEYSVCKCRPCHNGGTLALLDGKCICMCQHLFEGLSCQNFRPDRSKNAGERPAVTQEGNWSCWSFWSGCSGGKRTRTRSCNTHGVAGAVCSGETFADEYC